MGRFEERFVTAQDGLRLYARDYGDAAGRTMPVVCIPGLTRNSKDFAPVAEILAARRRVICIDLRGRGRSAYDPAWTNYNVMTELADVLAVMTALGVPEAAFLGTSRGGLITMLAAVQRPGAVRAAILNDIGPELAPEGVARIMGYVGKMPDPETWPDAIAAVKATVGDTFDLTVGEWERFARQIFRDDGGRPRLDYDPRIADALRESAKGGVQDLWPLFGALAKTPALVLRGAKSDLLSPAIVARMKAAHAGLVAVEVPGRGHAPFLDEPVSVAAIEALLAGLDGAHAP